MLSGLQTLIQCFLVLNHKLQAKYLEQTKMLILSSPLTPLTSLTTHFPDPGLLVLSGFGLLLFHPCVPASFPVAFNALFTCVMCWLKGTFLIVLV